MIRGCPAASSTPESS